MLRLLNLSIESRFLCISCLIVFIFVMLMMCSSAVDGPCSNCAILLCIFLNSFSMLSTLLLTFVILSVFCAIFCVSPVMDCFICSVFSVLFLLMLFICAVSLASKSVVCLSIVFVSMLWIWLSAA